MAALVDENYVGRAEMCGLQFASLLDWALSHLKFLFAAGFGVGNLLWAPKAKESGAGGMRGCGSAMRLFDGNVDCLAENPLVPKTVSVPPYWGPIREVLKRPAVTPPPPPPPPPQKK